MLTVRIPAVLDRRMEIEVAISQDTKQGIVIKALGRYLAIAEAKR